MLFNSFSYIIFLPAVCILHWVLPHRYRWMLLLAASYYFYMCWNPAYAVLILAATAVSYVSALFMEAAGERAKKIMLFLAAVFCFGILFVFKYLNFVAEIIFSMGSSLHLFPREAGAPVLNLLLPVGISFYTFQTVSYVIDVYRGKVEAEHHFGYYALFVSFFPQLAAGPIERAGNLLPQLKSVKKFEESACISGLKAMLWGYYKKIVVADTLAVYVNQVYGNLADYEGLALAVAAFFFSLQIYCDFSGYSDIAAGTAKLLGIDFMDNFAAPYFAASIQEFWKRWHISLSAWFRDYVYIPLGGSRCPAARRCRNLLITFLASGIWHGADWTFLVWGAIHGLAQVIEHMLCGPLGRLRQFRLGRFISWAAVFGFCNAAWVFFRADNLADAVYVLSNMRNGITSPASYIRNGYISLDINKFRLAYLAFLIVILLAADYFLYRNKGQKTGCMELFLKNPAVEWVLFVMLGVLVVLFSQKGAAAEFVYFQF